MISGKLIESLAADPMARLRWRVLKMLGIAPCSDAARSMTDAECITYAAHIVLDMAEDGETTANPVFSMERFRGLKEAEG